MDTILLTSLIMVVKCSQGGHFESHDAFLHEIISRITSTPHSGSSSTSNTEPSIGHESNTTDVNPDLVQNNAERITTNTTHSTVPINNTHQPDTTESEVQPGSEIQTDPETAEVIGTSITSESGPCDINTTIVGGRIHSNEGLCIGSKFIKPGSGNVNMGGSSINVNMKGNDISSNGMVSIASIHCG